MVPSGGKPKREAQCSETSSSGIEIYGSAPGCYGEGERDAAAGSQKMALVLCRSSRTLLKMATAREPINSPGQAVRRPDLSTRNSETVEVSQKLIFLKWEKDEAKPFFTCFPCKPLPHEEIKFNSFAAAPAASRRPLVLDPACPVTACGGCHTAGAPTPSPPHCSLQGRAG